MPTPLRAALPMLLLAGCYTYAPVQPAAVAPGTGVRARVSASAAEKIAPLLGSSDARLLAGTLIDNSSAGLIVEVPTMVVAGIAGASQTLNQRVSIAPGELLELETRKLDRGRTTLMVGIVTAIAGSAALAALH